MEYKYKLKTRFPYYSERLKGIEYFGRWGNICNNIITIYGDYAWDGCSIKFFKIGKLYIGTPDGGFRDGKWEPDITKYCSLVHDFMYQFHDEINQQSKEKLTREAADLIFYDRLKEEKFRLAKIYYLAVKNLGNIVWI